MNLIKVRLAMLCQKNRFIQIINLFKTASILLFILMINHTLEAQGIITIPSDDDRKLEICKSNTIDFEISGVSTSVDFELNIPTNLEIISVQNGTLNTGTTNEWNVNVTEGKAILTILLKPKCDYFSTANATITGKINNQNFTRNYEIIKGDLTFIDTSFTPNWGRVDLNEEVTRCFDYQNTADEPFSGNVIFVDSLQLKNDRSWIQFLDVEIGNNAGATISNINKIVTDSSIIYEFEVQNLPPDSVLTICNKIKLIKCTPSTSLNRSRTFFTLNYGCLNDTLTCIQTPIGKQEILTIRNNINPRINFRRINETRSCQANEDRHIYQIWNRGTGNATGIDFLYNSSLDNRTPFDLSKYDLDSANIELYYLDANKNKVYIDFNIRFFNGSVSPYRCVGCKLISSEERTIAPGDTVYLEFTERQLCELDEATFFNQNITMQNEAISGILRHDCAASGIAFHNRTDGRYPYFQRFSLSQNMPNLVATMTDQQEVWFAAKNLNQLWIALSSRQHPIYYFDTTTFRLEVDLKLTPGLCFKDLDSIFLHGNIVNYDIIPESVQLVEVDSMISTCQDSLCGGATVRLRFKLPNNFYRTGSHPYLSGNQNYLSQAYFDFFNDFEAKFLVKGECDCKVGTGSSEVKQSFYAIYDNTCESDCRIPISTTGDKLILNCPGCFVPGWNLEAMNLYRQNIDLADTDDNQYPDSYPMQTADPQLVRTDRIMIGDTVRIDVESFISNGDDNLGGYTFASSGFDYLFGQFSLEGTLLNHLELIKITGDFIENNIKYPFTINGNLLANKVKHNGSQLYLQLDAADWADIFGNNSFTSYGVNQFLNINFQFKVVGNLIDGDGIPPYMGRYEVVGRYHISGTDFSETVLDGNPDGSFKADALSTFPVDPSFGLTNVTKVQDLPFADRAELFYWCTHWESRITGVGVDNVFGANADRGHYQNVCLKKLNVGFRGATGQTIEEYNKNTYPVALNAFPFELRNIWMLDSFTFELPRDYKVSRILFNHGQTWKNNGLVQKTPYYGQWAGRTLPSDFIVTNNDKVTLHLHDFLDTISTAPILSNGKFTHSAYNSFRSFYGENKWMGANIELIPIDCQANPTGVDTVSMSAFIRNDPFHDFGNHEYSKAVTIGLRRGTPIFNVEITNKKIGQNGTDLSFDLKVVTNNIGHDYTPNSFVYFAPTSNGIAITELKRYFYENRMPPYSKTLDNGESIYGLGNMSAVKLTKKLSVKASYDCSQVSDLDSIMIIVGYGCDSLVSDLNNACRLDTFYMEISYNSPGLNATHLLTAPNSTCDTADYQITFDATGSVNVENVVASIDLPQGASLASSSGVLTFDNQLFNVTTNGTSNPFVFEIKPLDDNFIGTDLNRTNATFNLPILFDCDYDGGAINTIISSTDFCEKPLNEINLVSSIVNNLNKIDFSKVVLSNLRFKPVTTCDEASNYEITIDNTNGAASGNFQIDFYCTKNNNGILTPNCLIGSTNTLNIAANTQQKITTLLMPNCTNCTEIKAILKPLETCVCAANTQVLLINQNCNPCEIKADFTYVITEDCKLVITNKSISALPMSYNWEIKDLTGTVLTTSTDENPIFNYLTSPDFTICLVTNNTEGSVCSDLLCKEVTMCCVDDLPCDIDGEITMTADATNCEYFFATNLNISGNVNYTWQIIMPNGTVQNLTVNNDNIVFIPTTNGLHQIQVIAEWAKGEMVCNDTLKQSFDLKTCEPDCKFEGELILDEKGECTYAFAVINGITSSNYNWTVTAPDGSPVTAIGTTNNVFIFEPLISGIYQANVIVTWKEDDFECTDTLQMEVCLESCNKPCEYDGEIRVFYNERKCQFTFKLTNGNLLSNTIASWKVFDPNNGVVAFQTVSSTEIKFKPQITGLYKVEVNLEWGDGDEKCEKTFKLDRNLGSCKQPCQFEGEITVKQDGCKYVAFIDNAPTNLTYTWQLFDINNQLVSSSTSSQTAFSFTVPNTDFYKIIVNLTWEEEKAKCEKTLSLAKCLESCADKKK